MTPEQKEKLKDLAEECRDAFITLREARTDVDRDMVIGRIIGFIEAL